MSEADSTLEPEGYVVDVDGTRIHFLDWGGPPSVATGSC